MQNLSTALQNRVKTLGARFNEAKTKLDDLAKKLNESSEASGANSEETQKLAAQFAKAQAEVKNLGTQLVNAANESANADERLEELRKAADGVDDSIKDASVSTDELGESLEDASKETGGFSSKLQSLGKAASTVADKIDGVLTKAVKIGTGAIAAASAGVVALTKAAIAEYADYEQLVGGVDTLFKDSSQKVQEYAANAYKTAGLSANEYMETVTSFSASLLQSLDGDTAAAAEKADMAITDMSDNANKMGTDMESIQNAYQGFAKQNYTMLDNLKLGYGGTKEEMERLLRDAADLSDEFSIAVDENDELVYSYGDIVDAIHIVQTNMGITGTTAEEASSTIQGSIGSAKAAWQNLLIGLSDDSQDLDGLVDQFVDSVFTAADNLLPRISKTLDGILKLVTTVAQKILPTVMQEISKKLPSLIETGADIVLALGEGIVNNLDAILDSCVEVITELVPKIATAFQELVPKIAQSAKKIIKELNGTVEIVAGLYGAFQSLTKGNWIGVGIGLVVAAFGALEKAAAKAKQKTYDTITGLTKKEKELIKAGEEAAETLGGVIDARDDNIGSIEIETQKTEDLWKELQELVGANGKVIDKDKDRAEFLLGELNEALGTEYEMNGFIIEQYQQMQVEIDNLIQKRRASMLLENAEEAYYSALENRDALLAGANEKKEAMETAQEKYDEKKAEVDRLDAEYYAAQEDRDAGRISQTQFEEIEGDWATANAELDEIGEVLKTATENYKTAAADANEAIQTITDYEQAYSDFENGLYSNTVDILTKDTTYRWKHIQDISKLSEEELAQLENDIFAQQAAVDFAREQYREGVEGYTLDILEDMEETLHDLGVLWEEATGEAYDAGRNVAYGLAKGISNGVTNAREAARGITRATLDAMKEVAFIASPSKVTTAYGRYLAEGLALGMEDETATVARSASELIKSAIKPIDAMSVDVGVTGSVTSGATEASQNAPYNINITVHADTDDLGVRIASELQDVLDNLLSARGNLYRNGRTNYAY